MHHLMQVVIQMFSCPSQRKFKNTVQHKPTQKSIHAKYDIYGNELHIRLS